MTAARKRAIEETRIFYQTDGFGWEMRAVEGIMGRGQVGSHFIRKDGLESTPSNPAGKAGIVPRLGLNDVRFADVPKVWAVNRSIP
jgi:hypothetical protein